MLIVFRLLLILLLVTACANSESNPYKSPQSAAEAFLNLIDQDNYQQSWTDASEWVRNYVDAEQWANHVGNSRKPLGDIDHREMSSIEFHDTLDDMPAGEYALVMFDSFRSGNLSAGELVGLTLESDSTWRVIGYQIL